MKKRDYYEILGVDKRASKEEIKRAYKRVAFQCHPDKNPGDPNASERFKEVSEAYSVLYDDEKRGLYDLYGHEGLERRGFTGFSNIEEIFASFEDIFPDIFGDFFGFSSRYGGRRRARARRGNDIEVSLDITFEEAFKGVKREISIKRVVDCSKCGGTGMKAGSRPATCPSCGGRGEIVRGSGFFSIRSTCPSCRGEGSVISDPCPSCTGRGRERIPWKVMVDIPAGVDTGMVIRCRGEGDVGAGGGPPGDLHININLLPHKRFRRTGNDIVLDIPLSFPSAALGCEVEVPTIAGSKVIRIPPGTQHSDSFILKGMGFPDIRGKRGGDQIVLARVTVPRKISAKGKELLREFAREMGEPLSTPHKAASFFDRLKGDS